MILAGGTGRELSALTSHRTKTAVPFGGRYRIIDFCLSNCVHSGNTDIAILAQYNPKSLIEHIRMGKPWDLDRKSGGVYILQPAYHGEVANWYLGTADALFQNIDVIRDSDAEYIMVLSGDQVYTMDYNEMLDFHIQKRKQVTIAYKKVMARQRNRFGMVRISVDGTVTDFNEKPRSSTFQHASLGIYIFNRKFLLDNLDSGKTDIDFDIVIPALEHGGVAGFLFDGYWEDIGSIPSYFRASLRLLKQRSIITRKDWPIYTRGEDLAPAKYSAESSVKKSIVGAGCIIKGEVSGTILFPGAVIEKGARVKDSIIFSFARIGSDAKVRNAIIDKGVIIGRNSSVGISKDTGKGLLDRYADLESGFETGGITLIGKETVIRKGVDIPRGIVIEPRSKVRV